MLKMSDQLFFVDVSLFYSPAAYLRSCIDSSNDLEIFLRFSTILLFPIKRCKIALKIRNLMEIHELYELMMYVLFV